MLTRVKTIAAAFVMAGFLAGAVAPTFAPAAQAQTEQPAKKQTAKKQTAKKHTAKKQMAKKKPAA
ncbi:MAG TPA: hypothetical protein VF194_15295 [Ferrovibrio sp.]|uniref:hypothetical protein n=1 Tax=Ferrovibrio sp. TaxID=1917215 RepID=UPI002ED3042A